MSNAPQGPGWWLAADQKWYPPELHPGYTPPLSAEPRPASQWSPEPTSGEPLEEKSFLRSLFDFSFSSFVALRVIRVLYVLITILLTLGAVVTFVGLIAKHTAASVIVAIIVVPLGYVIYLTFARIYMEVLMVLFNLGKDVRAIRDRNRPRSAGPV